MNDTLKASLDELEATIQKIKTECFEKQIALTEDFKDTIQLLTTEEWISLDNGNFVGKMNEFIQFANQIGQYYNSVADDLAQFKESLEFEMNKKDNIHYTV